RDQRRISYSAAVLQTFCHAGSGGRLPSTGTGQKPFSRRFRRREMTSALFGCGVWKSCSRVLTGHPLCAWRARPVVGLLVCDPLRVPPLSMRQQQRAVRQLLTIAGKRGREWLRFGKLSSRSSPTSSKRQGGNRERRVPAKVKQPLQFQGLIFPDADDI